MNVYILETDNANGHYGETKIIGAFPSIEGAKVAAKNVGWCSITTYVLGQLVQDTGNQESISHNG